MEQSKLCATFIVFALITGCFYILPSTTDASPGHAIVDIGGPADVTFRGVLWEKHGEGAYCVGTDLANNGVVYRHDLPSCGWGMVPGSSRFGVDYNAITRTQTYFWYEDAECGLNNWTTNSWNGTLDWHTVDPTTLPIPNSGTSHGFPKSPDNIWWFGNDTTGDYTDNTSKVAGSLISPPIWMPDISTVGALVFYHWFDVESYAGSAVDRMRVSIKNTTDSGWTQLAQWSSQDASFNNWREEVLFCNWSVGNYIQLNFTFDTIDATFNKYAGWHLDDIVLVTNDMMIIVGDPGGSGHSAYCTDGFSKFDDIGGLNTVMFNDVAPGALGASFMAIGESGVVRYWNNSAWHTVNGAQNDEVLTGVDHNGSYYFIVGYDSLNKGVAYYITDWELINGYYNMHPFRGPQPNWKLNDVAWTNKHPTEKGKGLGVAVANGTAMSFLDPEMWFQTTPNPSPPARRMQAMVYNSQNNRHIMFGGYGDATGVQADTWTYHVGTRTWTLQPTAGGAPSARYLHAMAYDSERNLVVLFGGHQYNAETWVYDLLNDTWTQKFPSSSPSGRHAHAMTYDSARGLVVLQGGRDSAGLSNQTWTYDISNGPNGIWNLESTMGPALEYHSMVYDPMNAAITLFGGSNGGAPLDQTWVYSGNTWTLENPSPKPAARIRSSMTYDTRMNRVLMYGGHDGSSNINDLWTYNVSAGPDGTWNYFNYLRSPEQRSWGTITYDSMKRRMVMFGGQTDTGDSNQTWVVDFSTPWNGEIDQPALGTNGENFTACAWDNSGLNATFVGDDYVNGNGVVYSYYLGNYFVAQVPDVAGVLAGHALRDIAFKPESNLNQAIIVGASAFKLSANAVDQSTTVLVNTAYPHIFNIDMWGQSDPTRTSRLNDQVDVNTTYTFFVEANYTIGGFETWTDVELNLTAWYDGGLMGTLSNPPDAAWSAGDARTRQFRLYYNANNDTAWMNYPLGPPNEFSIFSWWADPNTYGGPGELRHHVYINVTFREQTISANGNNFLNGPAFGGRIWSKNDALNDPSSWDFQVGVYDVNNIGAVNYSWEEFAVNEAVSISVTGNPTLNAPPGTVSTLMNFPSIITYSSNARYWVNVSLVDDLYFGGSPPGPSIGATNISVLNFAPEAGTPGASDIAVITTFIGPGFLNDLCVWGNRIPGVPLLEPLNGTQTSGPWRTDYHTPGVTTQVNWYAAVPAGIPEGLYWTVITMRIETY
jgi:hypothetical protein